VLERGTHAELLADENGAYYRLVKAQTLREGLEDDDLDTALISTPEKDVAKARLEEVLERKSTIRSIGSNAASQLKERVGVLTGEEDYGIFYLMRRIASLYREGFSRYMVGSVFAVCRCTEQTTQFSLMSFLR